MSLRIIAGRYRGRRIATPKGLVTRPTSDRAREALFSILEQGSPPLRGSRFLDLFAGSGAAGLEALSRGAATALLVDQAAAAIAVIKDNIRALGEEARAGTLRADACRLGMAPHPFDIVFLDPPYNSGLLPAALERLRAGGWLAPGARLVCEVAAKEPFTLVTGFELVDERCYGAARFVFLRESGITEPAAGIG